MQTEISGAKIIGNDTIVDIRLYMNNVVELVNEMFRHLPDDKYLQYFPKVSGIIDQSMKISEQL